MSTSNEVNSISVLIVDDHDMVRKGLVVLLEQHDDIDVMDTVSDGEIAHMRCQEECPDVILMDMVMPHSNGVEATKKILKTCPQTKIIALTSITTDEYIQDVLEAGAISYLLKDVSGEKLAEAIRLAHQNKSILSPEAARMLIKATVNPETLGHDLTPRELEILTLMATGLNNREIGQNLIISSSTVKNHVSSILRKLDTANRTHAVALAIENELIEIEAD